MLKDSIKGLEKVFKTDIIPPKVILVTGPPGSMKTSFCYTFMSRYLKQSGKFGLYTTLEESLDSHLKNLNSLGIEVPDNMQISDFTDLREIDEVLEPTEATNYLEFVQKMIEHFKRIYGDDFVMFALDSLGALYSLMEEVTEMRKKMFYFFKMLRENNLISLVVMERSIGGESALLGNEGFLVDGIIDLGLDRTRGKLVRYLRVEKMRACEHSMEKHAIVLGKGGMAVLGPVFESGEL